MKNHQSLKLAALFTVLLLSARAASADVQAASAQKIGSAGWVSLSNKLFWTWTAGLEWREITPPFPAGTQIAAAHFTDISSGFALGFLDGGWTLAQTFDTGQTWSLRPLPIPGSIPADFSGAASISPAEIRLRLVSSSNFIREIVLVSSNGGFSWNRQPDPPIRPNEPLTETIPFDGWVIRTVGTCAAAKTGCTRQTRLYATSGGGLTLRDITPAGSPLVTVVSTNKGFDQCSAASTSAMQTWVESSPYSDTNLYIGGVERGCSQPNLSAAYVTALEEQGWGIIPTWVGPQAPCNGFSSSISENVSTAADQGTAQAKSAVIAARSFRLGASIVYYDMEAYTSSACNAGAAVGAFINAWTVELHSAGFLAGVYGSPSNAESDWTVIANLPDAVWIALWNGNPSVENLSPLSNSYWADNQRIHQYRGSHNETWGGVTFNIDNDNEDGPVAAP